MFVCVYTIQYINWGSFEMEMMWTFLKAFTIIKESTVGNLLYDCRFHLPVFEIDIDQINRYIC